MPEHVFVSYAKRDEDWVVNVFIETLYNSLQRLKKTQEDIVFTFYREEDPRDEASQLTPESEKQLAKATFFVAVTSPAYIHSRYCEAQLRYFIQRADSLTKVIEVEINDVNPNDDEVIAERLNPLRKHRGGLFYKLWRLDGITIIPAGNDCQYEIEAIATDLMRLATELTLERKSIAQIDGQLNDSDKFVFIDAIPRDKHLAEQIRDSLKSQKIQCTLPLAITKQGSLTAQMLEEDLIQSIKRCTAMLIVCGAKVPRAWVEQHYRYYQKIKSQRAHPVKVIAICEEKRDPLLLNHIEENEENILRLPCSPFELNKFMEVYRA